ncbi:hypothetical protein CS542_03375 [Pedobacter sp. IW39]|nr:hypothetical protein CS542_03375 [Pedobacter sp. IW39]
MKQKVALALLLPSLYLDTALYASKTGIHLLQTHQVKVMKAGIIYWQICPNKLYISYLQVNIINETTGDSIGIISNTPGVHGIAIVPALKRLYQ